MTYKEIYELTDKIEKDWKKDKKFIAKKMKNSANYALGKHYSIGDYNFALYTIVVTINTITKEGYIICDAQVVDKSGVVRLIQGAYRLLGLRTFFTAGADECRAWTIHVGDKAPKAAGVIHTDFEKGFIRAEVIKYDDFVHYKTEAAVRAAGKMGIEGKDYVVQDGDIMHFLFNV